MARPPLASRTGPRATAVYPGLAVLDAILAGSSHPPAHRVRRVSKPLLMPTLAVALAAGPRATRSPLRRTTLAAQAFGWLGDVFLLSDDKGAFTAGAGSFAVGHLSYIRGFRRLRTPDGRLLDTRTARCLAVFWACGAPVVAAGAFREDKALGVGVLGYSAVLSTMVAHAAELDAAVPTRARRLTAAGAATFLVSDSLLGTRRFLLSDPPAWLESVVMATYTAAQLLLARGAAAAGA